MDSSCTQNCTVQRRAHLSVPHGIIPLPLPRTLWPQVRLQQLCQDLSRVAGGASGEAAAKGAEQLAGLVAEARDNFLWEGLERLAATAAMEPEVRCPQAALTAVQSSFIPIKS